MEFVVYGWKKTGKSTSQGKTLLRINVKEFSAVTMELQREKKKKVYAPVTPTEM
jgi:hypothetical protein